MNKRLHQFHINQLLVSEIGQRFNTNTFITHKAYLPLFSPLNTRTCGSGELIKVAVARIKSRRLFIYIVFTRRSTTQFTLTLFVNMI